MLNTYVQEDIERAIGGILEPIIATTVEFAPLGEEYDEMIGSYHAAKLLGVAFRTVPEVKAKVYIKHWYEEEMYQILKGLYFAEQMPYLQMPGNQAIQDKFYKGTTRAFSNLRKFFCPGKSLAEDLSLSLDPNIYRYLSFNPEKIVTTRKNSQITINDSEIREIVNAIEGEAV